MANTVGPIRRKKPQTPRRRGWAFREPPSAVVASYPDRYIAQHLVPLFHDRFVSSVRRPDQEIEHEQQFWQRAQQKLFSVVHLHGFYLCDWFPQTPGVFWTDSGVQARNSVYHSQTGHDPDLGQYFLPQAKMSLVEEGGIGNVRLLPKVIDGVRCWFATAIRDNFCDAGIPLAIPEDLLIRSSTEWGDRVEITGCIRFLNDAGLDRISASIHGIRVSVRRSPLDGV